MKIPLVQDTIDHNEIDSLIEWLKTYPRLTKGNLTIELEKKWSEWIGRKYSVFLNSGSSANLAMFYSLMLSGKLRNHTIVAPAVSWVTTVSPAMQLGMKVHLCDTDKNNLGVDIEHLKHLIKLHYPSVLIIVNVLGFPNSMDEIIDLCKKNDIILLEDSCESVGSVYNDELKTGQFGLMSSFSTYYSHHFSTIEGGFVSMDDENLYNILKSIRAHGWDRDLEPSYQHELRTKYNTSDFKSLYTFYYPGFNLRSTDLQAFIGLSQLDKLDDMIKKRNGNYLLYDSLIHNNYWKIKPNINDYISNFAYPVIHPNIDTIVKNLSDNGVETRPLICGSIANQPFYKNIYGETKLEFADIVDKYGLYLPNNHQMGFKEINYISKIVNDSM